MDRMLRMFKIGRKEARYIAVCSLAFLVMLVWQAWSFMQSPAGPTGADTIFFVTAGVLSAIVATGSVWLGFTAGGRRYFDRLLQGTQPENPALRVSKVIFAGAGLAFAIFILLFIAFLFVGGSESVMPFFDGSVVAATYGALVFLSLPVVLKCLK